MDEFQKSMVKIAAVVAVIGIVLIGICMWVFPVYDVWQQGLKGQAEFKRAEQNRRITVQEAEAKRDAAVALSAAEVERAKGVAEANRIIGESLKDNESYLRYLWVQGLQDGSSEVIYVPTEANLPILEATRKLP